MLNKNKHVFWEALLITFFVFGMGIFLGMAYEGNKLKVISQYYDQSEIFLNDMIGLERSFEFNPDCGNLIQSNLEFADKIYAEALLLEQYESAEKFSEDLLVVHKRYDLLRTFLWMNTIKIANDCPNEDFSSVVYLYEYQPKDLVKKAKNSVWSKILFDLKLETGSGIVLIPIAINSDLSSLNSLTDKFNITEYPVVIINNKKVITELTSTKDLISYLN